MLCQDYSSLTCNQGPQGNYFIWSGWTDPSNTLWQNLYIAKMASPTQLTGDRVLLHQPMPSWQQSLDENGIHGINESPVIVQAKLTGRVFLVYCTCLFPPTECRKANNFLRYSCCWKLDSRLRTRIHGH